MDHENSKLGETRQGNSVKLSYSLAIDNPSTHIVSVKVFGKRSKNQSFIDFYLPSWSRGSYLIREYAQHVNNFRAFDSKGGHIYFEKTSKNIWRLNWEHPDLPRRDEKFEINYNVYCHDLTVRTAFIDSSFAFLHPPAIFMGVVGENIKDPTIALSFPGLWSKVATSLKDISKIRDEFLYSADDYDQLIDSPIQIGCHESDGYHHDGVDHHLAFAGDFFRPMDQMKSDIRKITEKISSVFKNDMPFDEYHFISHFYPRLFGGLEHKKSTVLQYCSLSMKDRHDYITWLSLVSHEYFHAWHVLSMRPPEYGKIDYSVENYTKLLWLYEGLTTFIDELFVYRSDLCSEEEYLKFIKDKLNRFLKNPGRKFQTLEESSFDTWIKLYRPSENTRNSQTSYYLKGSLVFFTLAVFLFENGSDIESLIDRMWSFYRKNPKAGIGEEEFSSFIKDLLKEEQVDEFYKYIKTTSEIDFISVLGKIGVEVEYTKSEKIDWGIKEKIVGDNIIVQEIIIDGPAYSAGLCVGDEIISIDKLRIKKDEFQNSSKFLEKDRRYELLISRKGEICNLSIVFDYEDRFISNFKIVDKKKTVRFLKGK